MHCGNLCNRCDQLAIKVCRSCNKAHCQEHLLPNVVDAFERCTGCYRNDYDWTLDSW